MAGAAGAFEGAVAAAEAGDVDAGGEAVVERLDVGDDADQLALLVEGAQHGEGDFERLGVEGAEAFVDEQRVHAVFAADHVGQAQGQGEAGEELLAP